MTVQVQSCDNGSFGYFRLGIPANGSVWHETVRGEVWDRATATESLNLCESVYGLTRSNIRFAHA